MAIKPDPRFALADKVKPAGFVLCKSSTNPDKGATHVPFFGRADSHGEYVKQGYIPMKVGDRHVNESGDLGYFIPLPVAEKKIEPAVKKAGK